ncbi:MAG: hypothetical protein JST16_15130 [Bdellovibrionales bacterium]|nr:hypothetical protein [Bdellovibrionales bacterium]
MSAEVYGNSPAAAYTAALLASSRTAVTWCVTASDASLRPALLRGPVVGSLRRLLARHHVSVDFLLQAPELEYWGVAGRPLSRFNFNFLSGESDRWVNVGVLMQHLGELAQRLGVTVRTVPSFPAWPSVPPADTISFVDVEDSEVPHWPMGPAVASSLLQKWQLTEVWFAQTGGEIMPLSQFMPIDGSIACLEPSSEGGYVLTLLSKSRYSIERALGQLTQPRGTGPRFWRALALMNPSPRRRDVILTSGPSRQNLPEAFALGASIGLHSPCVNLRVSDSLEQAERLHDSLLNSQVSPEEWRRAEAKRFLAVERKVHLWEKLMFSERFHDDALTAASYLPRPLRDYLKSPF